MNFLLPWLGVGVVYFFNNIFPTSFNTLFLINVWIFSLPHTFSTFTRHDRRDLKSVLPIFTLFIIFLGAVIFASGTVGIVVVYSFYFYWQQFHYGKQNLGLSRWQSSLPITWVDHTFYLLIVALGLVGLLGMEKQGFFGYVLYFPLTVPISKGVIFLFMVLLTGIYTLLRPKQLLHALNHTLIFGVAYIFSEHFAAGWLLLNVFHNIQYLTFMKNVEKKLSFILLPVILTCGLYILQVHALKGFILWFLPLNVALMLSLNFTHYTLDGFIWKTTKNSFGK